MLNIVISGSERMHFTVSSSGPGENMSSSTADSDLASRGGSVIIWKMVDENSPSYRDIP